MSRNFDELVDENTEAIKTTKGMSPLCSVYINTSLVRKLGHNTHSLIYKHLERESERERERERVRERERERERAKKG